MKVSDNQIILVIIFQNDQSQCSQERSSSKQQNYHLQNKKIPISKSLKLIVAILVTFKIQPQTISTKSTLLPPTNKPKVFVQPRLINLQKPTDAPLCVRVYAFLSGQTERRPSTVRPFSDVLADAYSITTRCRHIDDYCRQSSYRSPDDDDPRRT